MHCAVDQATAHETINAGWTDWNAVYSILLDDQTHDKKHEETLQQLCTEADQAWKDTNDLVFNHQLHYDGQLMAFISNAERTLQEKEEEVWGHIHRLADMAGISHDLCPDLTLQIPNRLPTIPIKLSFCTPISLMLAYGPESYAYQTSSIGKEVRAPGLLTRKLKWLGPGEE